MKTCPQCGSEYELDVMFCPRDGSTLRAPAGGSLVGTIVADRYHILRKLGEGGMGQVYLAEHVKMGRKSAIKVMNPGMSTDTDAIGRFNREAANASRISQANVAAIYDFGETLDGLIYLAMEYVDGEPLTTLMEREGVLAPARAADITRQVADALDAAHDMGIVHRDLKPDNIMLAKQRDGSDLVKVVDFGIAKAQAGDGQKVTKTGLVVGTPEYMSPEQLAGDALDGRSDNYTLGLVAFHMLTGKLPFPSETIQESMIMRLTDRPRTLADMRPEVQWPAAVQEAMDRELQRRAEDRYPRASQFALALSAAAKGMQGAPASATAAVTRPLPDSVPPTRVRGDGAGVAGAAGAPGGPAQPVAAKKRGMLVPASAGAGVIAIAVAAWLVLPHPGSQANAAGDSTRSAHVSAPAGTDTQTLAHAAPGVQQESTATAPVVQPGSTATAPIEQHPQQPPGPNTTPVRDAAAHAPAQQSPAAAAKSSAPPRTPAHDGANGRTSANAAAVAKARQQVEDAYQITGSEHPDLPRAFGLLSSALKRLPTRDDSTRAHWIQGETLFLQAQQTSNDALRTKGCDILRPLLSETANASYKAIRNDYDSQCK